MANKKVKIDFEANGLQKILDDLSALKSSALKVHVPKTLEDQLDDLEGHVIAIKNELYDLQTALNSASKNQTKNSALAEMDKKIETLKKGMKSLHGSITALAKRTDAELSKLDTAVDKLNRENLFSNLTTQLNNINNTFDELIRKATKYRELLSEPLTVQPQTKGGKSVSPSNTNAQELSNVRAKIQKQEEALSEFKKSRDRLPKTGSLTDKEIDNKFFDKTEKELVDYLEQLDKRAFEVYQKREEALQKGLKAEANKLSRELINIFNEFSSMANVGADDIKDWKIFAKHEGLDDTTVKNVVESIKKYQVEFNNALKNASNESEVNMDVFDQLDEQYYQIYSTSLEFIEDYTERYSNAKKNAKTKTLDFISKAQLKADGTPLLVNEDTGAMMSIAEHLIKTMSDKINQRIADLDQKIATAENTIKELRKEESQLSASTGEVAETDNTIEKLLKKGNQIITLRLAGNAEQTLMDEITAVIDSINSMVQEKPVKVQVEFESKYRARANEGLAKDLEKSLKNIDDPEVRTKLETLIPRIRKQFKGALHINITSNIEELEQGIPQAMTNIRKSIEDEKFNAKVDIDHDAIQAQINKLGTFTLPVGGITVSKDIDKKVKVEQDKIDLVREAQEKAQKEAREKEEKAEIARVAAIEKEIKAIEAKKAKGVELSEKEKQGLVEKYNLIKKVDNEEKKAKKDSKALSEQDVSAENKLQQDLVQYIQTLMKLPSIIQTIRTQIKVIELEGTLKFNVEDIRKRLAEIDGLELRIARLDVYQPTLDKVKFTIKQDLIEWIEAQNKLVESLNTLNGNLTPAVEHISKSVEGSQFESASKTLVDAINSLKLSIDSLGLIERTLADALKGVQISVDSGNIPEHVETAKETAKETREKKDSESLKNEFKKLYEGGKKPSATSKNIDGLDTGSSVNNIENDTSQLVKTDKEIERDLKRAIAFAKKETDVETPNEVARVLKGWITSSNIMGGIIVPEGQRRKLDQLEEGLDLDRERYMKVNAGTGEHTPEYITAMREKVPDKLVQEISKIGDYIRANMEVHSHADDYISPSIADMNVWKNRLKNEDFSTQVTVGRKQMMKVDLEGLNYHDIEKWVEQFEILKKATSDGPIDAKTSRQLLEQSYQIAGLNGKKLFSNAVQTLDYENINQLHESDISKFLGLSTSFKDMVREFLSTISRSLIELIDKLDLSSLENLISKVDKNTPPKSGGKNVGGFESDTKTNRPIDNIVKKKGTEIWSQAISNRKNIDALLDEFTLSKYKNLRSFANKYKISDENYSILEKRALEKGIEISASKAKEQGKRVAQNVADGIEENKSEIQKSLENSAKVPLRKEWYGKYLGKKIDDYGAYDTALQKDLGIFKKNIGKNGLSDLEYMQDFYNEYLDYLSDAIERTKNKDKKSKLKKYKKFVQEKAKAIDEEDKELQKTVKANQAEYDTDMKEAEKRVNQERLNEEKQFADNQRNYDEQIIQAKKENAEVARQTVERIKQEELNYDAQMKDVQKTLASENKQRMKNVGTLYAKSSALYENKNLVGGSKQGVKELLDYLNEIKTKGEITVDEFKELEETFKRINNQANESIDNQVQMNDLVGKLIRLENKQLGNTGQSFFMPDFLNSVIALRTDMQSKLQNGTVTQNDIQMVMRKLAEGANPSTSIMRASKTSLENYILKGEKMLSTNYLPGGLASQLRDTVDQMRALDSQADISVESMNKLTSAFRMQEIEAAKLGKTFIGQIGQRLKDMNAKFIATYFSFMDIIRYTRSMITTITELDTALTEMRKVSDESTKSLKAYQQTTFDTAGALGTTAVQLQQSTADWMRLGESMEEAAKSAQAATTLLNVSEFENISDATTALVAMSQAYKDMDKTEIIDVMNNIGNNYSIATDQLAMALQNSAAVLMTQGNDLYEATALVTAANAIVQDYSKSGTGIRTIALRMAGVKEGDDEIKKELEEMGEEVDDWVVSTQAKKRQVIMDYTRVASNQGQGIDILDSNGNLRDTYHILLDIAKIYKEIQEEDEKYGTNRAKGLVEELAGKTRANIASSILLNPEMLENVYNSALDSAGSAAEENAKYLDSIVGKTQQFKNELQELEQNILSSEFIKDVIDFGTTILSLINKIGKGLPIIATGIGSIAFAMTALKDKTQGIFNYDEASGSLAIGNKLIKQTVNANGDIVPQMINSITKSQARNLLGAVDFKETGLREFFSQFDNTSSIDEVREKINQLDNKGIKPMAETLVNNGVKSLEQFDQAEKTVAATSKMTATEVSILNTAITAGIAMAVSIGISLAVKGIKKLINYSKELEESAQEASRAIEDINKEIHDNTKYLNEVSEEYAKLSKGVDAFGRNVTLSNNEFERYQEISNGVAEIMPELVQGWTNEGNAIIKVTDNINELNAAYEEHRKQQLAQAASKENVEATAKDFLNYQYQGFWEGVGSFFTNLVNYKGVKKTGYGIDYDTQQEVLNAIINSSLEEINDRLNNDKGFKYTLQAYYSDDIFESLFGNAANIEITDLAEGKGVVNNQYTISQETLDKLQREARSELSAINQKLNEKMGAFKESIKVTFAYNLENSDKNLDAETQVIAEEIIDSLDRSFLNALAENPIELNAFTNTLIDSLDQMDSDALMALFGIKSDDAVFKETEEQLLNDWKVVYDDLMKQISETDDVDEKRRLSNIMEQLWKASGMEDFVSKDDAFQNSLAKVIANTADEESLKELEELTKDFSANNMQMWLEAVEETDNATQAIQRYKEALEGVAKATSYESIGKLFSQDTIVDDSLYSGPNAYTWKDVKNDLVGLAQAGKLDETTLKEYEYYNEILKALGISAEDADEAISGMVDSINKMATNNAVDDMANYRTEMDKLGDAYSKFKKGEFIDANTLSSLQDAFGDLDSYQEFEKAVMSGEKDLQQYFNAMVSEYADAHNILRNLNEDNAEYIKQSLIRAGITKESAESAVESALKEKKALEGRVAQVIESANTDEVRKNNLKTLVVDTNNLSDATISEVSALMQEAEITGEAANMIEYYVIQKDLAQHSNLRNQDDLNYLIEVCNLAGIASNSLRILKNLSDNSQNYTDTINKANSIIDKYGKKKNLNPAEQRELDYWKNQKEIAQKHQDDIGKYAEEAWDDVTGKIKKKYEDYEYKPELDYGGMVDDATSGGEAAAEAFKETLDKILAMYDAELDAGVVAFKDYVKKSREIIEQYYREGKITASEYYDYIASLYEKQISEYDKVISAVQRVIKKQVDELEKQKESIEESYNKQIEEIQKKIDVLQEENDEIDKNIALQKAQ